MDDSASKSSSSGMDILSDMDDSERTRIVLLLALKLRLLMRKLLLRPHSLFSGDSLAVNRCLLTLESWADTPWMEEVAVATRTRMDVDFILWMYGLMLVVSVKKMSWWKWDWLSCWGFGGKVTLCDYSLDICFSNAVGVAIDCDVAVA